MSVDKIFHVVSEFSFDVQGAVASSGVLTSAVGRISDAANLAFNGLKSIPMALQSAVGLNLGFAGIMMAGLKSSEEMTKSQLMLTNLISSNMEHLTGDIQTFNDRMTVSKNILTDIAKTAREFSLNEGAFVKSTISMSAMLTQKGLAGDNFGTAKNMARGLMKSAPMLGVDPDLVQNQLMEMISGSASMNDTLFRRLAAETSAFKPLMGGGVIKGVGGAKDTKLVAGKSAAAGFNKLDAATRVNLLEKALTQFGDNAEVNAGIAALLSNRLVALRNQFFGLDGVLRPIGDVLAKRMGPAFTYLSNVIETKLRPIVQHFANGLDRLLADPARLIATITQMRALKGDLAQAASITKTIGIATLVITIAKFAAGFAWVQKLIPIVTTFALRFAIIGTLVPMFAALAGTGLFLWKIVTIMNIAFKIFSFVIGGVLAPLILLIGFLQTLSRAKGYADIIDTKAAVDKSTVFADSLARLTDSFFTAIKPITDIIDEIAQFIAPALAMSTYIEGVTGFMDMLSRALFGVGKGLVYFIAGVQGIFVGLFQALSVTFPLMLAFQTELGNAFRTMFTNLGEIVTTSFSTIIEAVMAAFDAIKSGNVLSIIPAIEEVMLRPGAFGPSLTQGVGGFDKSGDLLSSIGDAMKFGRDDVLTKYAKVLNGQYDTEKKVAQRTTNIGKVEIRNDFKENLEPDRIANSLVNTLMSIANNPTQAAGRAAFFGAQ